jgi:phage-related protein
MTRLKKVPAVFYQTKIGARPVRAFLLGLPRDDRRIIGNDIATVEYGWPIGKPTCAPLGLGLWEVRSDLTSNRIARVIFTLHEERMWLLHGFIKKTQKTPNSDIDIARKRKKEVKR